MYVRLEDDSGFAHAVVVRTAYFVEQMAGGRKLIHRTLGRFLRMEAVSGVLLLIAAAAGVSLANSSYSDVYFARLESPIPLGGVRFWINDGLMTLFFLVVGLEIGRERESGVLRHPRQALLPVAAACGGVIVPALIYLSANSLPALHSGWAVPTATDIAFAVGILGLLGPRIPGPLRTFVLTLAVIDDVIAVVIIALFYSHDLRYAAVAVAAAAFVLMFVLRRAAIGAALPYIFAGALLWLSLYRAGIHPALAGVVIGLALPRAAADRFEGLLHPISAYLVMPLFAFANAGIRLGGFNPENSAEVSVAAGVAVALIVGKPVGVIGTTLLLVRTKAGRLAGEINWSGVTLIGLLAGIGFTMSIFVALLAFESAPLLAAGKLGVLIGSVTAAVLSLCWGAFYLQRATRTSCAP